MTYEEKLVAFAEMVLTQIETERAWYQTPGVHMRVVGDPRYQYSTVLQLLREACHMEIDIEEVVRRYEEKCAACTVSEAKVWHEKTYREE